MHDHTELEVWREARRIAGDVYRMTARFPDSERFGLSAQMRRAAVTIASNIAEGASRSSGRDFGRYLEIAAGSAAELETQLLIAPDVGLLAGPEVAVEHRAIRRLRARLERLRRSRDMAQTRQPPDSRD
jgi:four helix bundle protein